MESLSSMAVAVLLRFIQQHTLLLLLHRFMYFLMGIAGRRCGLLSPIVPFSLQKMEALIKSGEQTLSVRPTTMLFYLNKGKQRLMIVDDGEVLGVAYSLISYGDKFTNRALLPSSFVLVLCGIS